MKTPLSIGLACAGFLILAIYLGSHQMGDFDPALTWYAVASVLGAFAVGYRFTVWAQRPPSRMYFNRGLELAWRYPALLFKSTGKKMAAQTFIKERSHYRWIMHLCLSGGCTLAFAVAFPLVFGWIHFDVGTTAEIYQAKVFGAVVREFSVHSLEAKLIFNMLNIAAAFVLVGLLMACWRRLTNAGVRAVQSFTEDILPLLIIFAVTATGFMLTVSYSFLKGQGHAFLVWMHLLTVVLLIFYVPFGKLFHMFQRLCSVCVGLYKQAGEEGPQADCVVCYEEFASQMHVDDLKTVLDQLGFNYRFATSKGEVHYQDICPKCRRRLLAANQGKTLGR
jgi:nitrate reductase gamma subunit|tara:strand:+ start:3832 stop:4836 length:1005 start_codon:yes stop_codon:yes gene_type:complete